MTDELTTDLATISQLRVISRGSVMQFKGDHRPPTPEIARILNVDAVVEGSVLRVGDKVRITAQLIDARADKHLWARSFERNSRDVLALQNELASAIAGEIHVQLTPAEESRLAAAPSVNPEAHDAYLKGRYPSLKKAQALESPGYATAWLAYAYGASGDRAHAMAEIENLKKRSLHGDVPVFNMAIAHLGLGDRKLALDCLERAYASDSEWLGWLKMDRMFDPLRSEPRFVALIRTLRLAQ